MIEKLLAFMIGFVGTLLVVLLLMTTGVVSAHDDLGGNDGCSGHEALKIHLSILHVWNLRDVALLSGSPTGYLDEQLFALFEAGFDCARRWEVANERG